MNCGYDEPRRETELFEHALRAGLTASQARDWVREQFKPKPPVQEQTPTLFGAFMARDLMAGKKGVR